jgi:ergothioneine biosynthesis protein EgtB
VSFPGGIRFLGHDGPGFAYDNETPAHRVWVDAFAIRSRLVTNREYLEFMLDGGYARPELWLSNGWDLARSQHWHAPLYWEGAGDTWRVFTLAGMRAAEPDAPVCHVSYYEADAFSRWAGHRLPREAEWEVAAAGSDGLGPLQQLFSEAWQWTQSPYVAYPGYAPPAGAIGEYNGKWMADQWVLRGASCVTPETHSRLTYRNFFPAATRWQFSGIRLARDS